MNRARVFLVLACSVVPVALACGGSGGDGGSDGGDERNGESAGVQRDESGWVALLALMPDTAETRQSLTIVDFERLYQQTGARPPAAGAAADEITRHLAALTTRDRFDLPALLGYEPSTFAAVAAMFPLSGFSFAGWRQAVSAGVPPSTMHAVLGKFDSDAIASAIHDCRACSEPRFSLTHEGVTYYGWGSRDGLQLDLAKRLAPPLFDQLGRGGRLAPLDNETLLRTVTDEAMKAMIDAANGSIASLARNRDMRAAVEALEEAGVVNALVTDRTQGPAEPFLGGIPPAQRAAVSSDALLEPYSTVAAGQGKDATGQFLTLVLVHADRSAARASEAAFRTRWATTDSLVSRASWRTVFTSADTDLDGRLLVITLRGPGASSLAGFLHTRDPLLLHR